MKSHDFTDLGSTPPKIEGPFREVQAEILAYANDEDPNECCGFVFAVEDELKVWRTRNAADSPSEFFIDPHDQYAAICGIERQGGEIVAIYHSHPFGTPSPSERDCAFAKLWPGVAMLIAAKGVVRAYDASGEPL